MRLSQTRGSQKHERETARMHEAFVQSEETAGDVPCPGLSACKDHNVEQFKSIVPADKQRFSSTNEMLFNIVQNR